MPETLRSVDGWTITLHPGYALLERGAETIRVRWTRRGWRCTCGRRGCGHPDVLAAARLSHTTGDWSGALEPW